MMYLEIKMEEEKKPVYEKPLFEKQEEMNFPIEIINSLGHIIRCNQCSACHGCE